MDEHGFENSINCIMMRMGRAYFNMSEEYMKELGLHHGQPNIIMSLYKNDGQSLKELTKGRKVKASTTTVMISRMEKSGIVEKRVDPDDQRIIRVYLTDHGKAIYSRLKEINSEIEKRCLEGFSVEEIIVIKRLLHEMVKNMENSRE